MGGLPPGPGSFPQATPPSLRRAFRVANRNVATQLFDVRGPFVGVLMPDTGTIQMDREGVMVTVDLKIQMPIESGVRARSILTDVTTAIAYEVIYARTWATYIETFVTRTQADA